MCNVFSACYPTHQILVHGPSARMVIGTAESPFQHRVVLTLTGRRGDSVLSLTSFLTLGSKAIGVFGNVSGCFKENFCVIGFV